MGFWDRDVRDGFDAMFDFNRDGHLDPFEQAMQFDFIEEGIRRDNGESEEEDIFGTDLDLDELEDMDGPMSRKSTS